MPTMEVQDFEHFNYDEQPLTLDEAIKKASKLRQADSNSFYRVRQVSDSRGTFVVKKVTKSSVYADFVARLFKLTRSARR